MSTTSPNIRSIAPNIDLKIATHRLLRHLPLQRISMSGTIIIGALIAFEAFNYGTTEFALADLLGDLRFAEIRWATILALAFCCMDFAGVARLFTPHRDLKSSLEVWYLLGAWFLAATMNAMLTWWSISLALLSHQGLGNELIGRETLLSGIPIFVAALVWLIRVLIIGIFTLTGPRLLSQDSTPPRVPRRRSNSADAKQRTNKFDHPSRTFRSARSTPQYNNLKEPSNKKRPASAIPPTRR
jgi:hypothetical protein